MARASNPPVIRRGGSEVPRFRTGGLSVLSFPGTKMYLVAGVRDMRKSFRGLPAIITNVVRRDPLSGEVFIFCNRRRNRLKIGCSLDTQPRVHARQRSSARRQSHARARGAHAAGMARPRRGREGCQASWRITRPKRRNSSERCLSAPFIVRVGIAQITASPYV